MDNKDKYVEKLKVKLDEWNAELNRLEAKAREAGTEARSRYEKELNSLREYYNEARQRYLSVQKATKDTWETLRQDAEEASRKLKESIDSYRSRNE